MKRNIHVTLFFVLFSFNASLAFEKSHSIMLVRMEKPVENKDWIEDCHFEFKKLDKGNRVFNMNFTAKQKIDGPDILCKMRIFQKTSGKYLKSPWDFPEKACCEFMEQYETGWECLQNRSSFPKRCPILEGPHWIKEFNVDECNYPAVMPPNMPEDYKIEVNVHKNGVRLLKLTIYAKIKRRMSFF